jgi:hypothetical protein
VRVGDKSLCAGVGDKVCVQAEELQQPIVGRRIHAARRGHRRPARQAAPLLDSDSTVTHSATSSIASALPCSRATGDDGKLVPCSLSHVGCPQAVRPASSR